ncbi:MAG: tetratricopeptide repeat protein [Myxococcales bacterium]|nr:tetratricopeptide repeat protein [Myxococcales bacterium]
MAQVDLRKLKDDAAEAVDRGKFKKALQCYEQLEQHDASDGNWSRRAAEMWRKLDDREQALAAYLRAVETYVRAGFLIQAVAMCKMALQLHPAHPVVMARLATLQQGVAVTPMLASPATPNPGITARGAADVPAASSRGGLDMSLELPPDDGEFVIERSATAGTSIDKVELARAVPGAHAVAAGGRAGFIELDLDDVEVEELDDSALTPSEPPQGGVAVAPPVVAAVDPAAAALRAVRERGSHGADAAASDVAPTHP